MYMSVVCNKLNNTFKNMMSSEADPLKLEKNKIFWRKIVIFQTKYPKKCTHPNLKSWIRP